MHPASLDPDVLLKQCTTRRYKASGPGGQHRNKVETAVELTHSPTGITAAATERRSQNDNQRAALKRLRLKLAIEYRTPGPTITIDPSSPDTLPGAGTSGLWQSRLKAKRIEISADHTDFPTLIAEALDTLAALGYDMPKAAAVLGTTSSQLIKLFQKEPAVMAKVNAERTSRGMRVLR
jgi:RF-1 domain